MIERTWAKLGPFAFTASGSDQGKATLASTLGLKVKMRVTLTHPTLDELVLEIKRVTDTYVILGPPGSIKATSNLSAYDTLTTLEAPEQVRPAIPLAELERATYEEEPTVAKRVVQVDRQGNHYTVDNPLPVQLSDGDINIDTLNAEILVQLDHTDKPGKVHDSVRIGDGTTEWDIQADGEGLVHDQDTHDRLDDLKATLQSESDETQALLQSEFDQTQDLLQTEFDETQSKLDTLTSVVQSESDQTQALLQAEFDQTQAKLDTLTSVVQSEFDQTQVKLDTLTSVVQSESDQTQALLQSEFDQTQALLQAEFDQTQSLLQTEFDQTQVKLDTLNTTVQNESDQTQALLQTEFDQTQVKLDEIHTRQADKTQFTHITDGTNDVLVNPDGSINTNTYEKIFALLQNANFLKLANYDSVVPEFSGTTATMKYYEDGALIGQAAIQFTSRTNWSMALLAFLNDDDGSQLVDDNDDPILME